MISYMNKNTCIAHTPYGLLLFMLLMDNKELENSWYFLGDSIDKRIGKNFKHVVRVLYPFDDLWKFRIKALILWRIHIFFTKVYVAQDQMDYMPALIGHSKYTLLEDAPGMYSRLIHGNVPIVLKKQGIRSKIHNLFRFRIPYGSIIGKHFGRNKQCINRIYSDPADSETTWLQHYPSTHVNLQHLWDVASDEKKSFIQKAFCVDNELFEICSKIQILIILDGYPELTQEQLCDIYKPYVTHFSNQSIAIKPHPATPMDYNTTFPNMQILPDFIPLQLLTFCGLHCKYAITISSSAISNLPLDTQIIWIGTETIPVLNKKYGAVPYTYKQKRIALEKM